MQDARTVWQTLDTGTYFADFTSRFEDNDIVACQTQGNRSSEAS